MKAQTYSHLLRLVSVLSCALISAVSVDAAEPNNLSKQQLLANVPYWDQDNAFRDAAKHLDVITDVSPWWYAPVEGGAVEVQDKTVRVDDSMVAFLRTHGIRVIPTIADHRNGNRDTQTITHILHDPAATALHVQAIVTLAMNKPYDGIMIDYEDLKSTDRQVFSRFITLLGNALHAEKKLLYICVHPKDSDAGYDERNMAQDYASLGHSADRLIVMIYDWHWSTSTPGPIAPVNWVEDIVRWSATQIPANKIIQGIGLYGYDWAEQPAQDKTWQDIMLTERTFGANIQFDNTSMSPWFRYESNHTGHEVWFENTQSIAAKQSIGKKYHLAGYSLWRLGGEQPEIWSLF